MTCHKGNRNDCLIHKSLQEILVSVQVNVVLPPATYGSLQENPALVTPGWFHSHCNFLTLSDHLLVSLVWEMYAQCTLLNCESIVFYAKI